MNHRHLCKKNIYKNIYYLILQGSSWLLQNSLAQLRGHYQLWNN